MIRVSLEVAIGFVVQLAVFHQFLHAGKGLGAVQGGTAEELAWQGRDGGQRSGVRWPRVSLGTLPASHHLPWPYLPGTVWVSSGYEDAVPSHERLGN